jgi:hypothetical protein
MPKIDLETTKFILLRNIPDSRQVAAILSDIQAELEAEEEERANRPPAVKKQLSIVLSDSDGSLAGKDIVGWVVQIPEDESVTTVPERIIQTVYDFNCTPKGARMPVKTIGEACEVISAKLFKEQSLWVKTKVPVLAVPVNNQIPTEVAE